MDWKQFWSQPAAFFISGTPEEVSAVMNALRRNKQLEKKGFQEMIEFK